MNLKRAIGGPLLALAFFVFFAYAIFGVKWVLDSFAQGVGEKEFSASLPIAAQNVEPTIPDLEISAASAISVESDLQGSDRVIFVKAGDEKMPIASLTKLMTAVIVLDNYNLSDTVVVGSAADAQAPMKQDVKLGQALTVENFLDIMMIESSNKAAYALSELMGEQKFVELMNQKAINLGLENTFFTDPTGISSEDISTASDLAKLAEYILKNYPSISDISSNKELYVPEFGEVLNTDQLLSEIPEIVCSKTGFTTAAKGCLLLVTRDSKDDDYSINIVLGADDRFSEMRKIINYSNAICN